MRYRCASDDIDLARRRTVALDRHGSGAAAGATALDRRRGPRDALRNTDAPDWHTYIHTYIHHIGSAEGKRETRPNPLESAALGQIPCFKFELAKCLVLSSSWPNPLF